MANGPVLSGLIVSLALLMEKILHSLAELLPNVLVMKGADIILAVRSLIDLAIASNLLIIVIFSGYGTFVSNIDVGKHKDRPAWTGKRMLAACN